MADTIELNLDLTQGTTFRRVIRWETLPYVYTAITAITQAAPMAVTAAGHNLKTGWRAAVVSAQGMRQANARHSPPRRNEMYPVTVLSASQVAFNDINSAEFDAYTSGGYLQSYTPMSIASYTARMTIKDRLGGTVLVSLVSPTDIALDDTNHTITVTITAVASAAFTWTKGVYDLELVSPAGVVTKLYRGVVSVRKEATT